MVDIIVVYSVPCSMVSVMHHFGSPPMSMPRSSCTLLCLALTLGSISGAHAQTDVSINMTQSPRTQQILPGAPTTVWSYSASLI